MSWAKLCDGYHCHEKTVATSLEANGLYAIALSWVAQNEKDGILIVITNTHDLYVICNLIPNPILKKVHIITFLLQSVENPAPDMIRQQYLFSAK